jgi:polyisoprenoid-binding protein YceI
MTTTTTTPDVAVGTYAIDASHSRVGFAVRHLGFSRVRGHFGTFSGEVTMEPGDLGSLSASATIEAGTIGTADERRDAHLRSADFFDVENHPELTFVTTGVRAGDDGQFVLAGDLTMRGVTRPVELDAVFLGEARDPWGGERVAFEAQTKVNRKDFGLNWNAALETGGFLVGEDVEIVLEIQAVKAPAQVSAN